MAERRDYYAELEVEASAPFEEVRAAYRRLARAHHPDVNPSAEAAERMRRINEAWEVLRDPARRAEYDRSRPAGAARAFAGARGGRPGPGGASAQGTSRPRARPSGAARQAPRPRPAEPPPQDGAPGGASTPRIDGTVDWYAFLGVAPGASREAIRRAIADLADELLGNGVSGERLTKQRQRLREAWAILGDERLRAAYDRARAEHLRTAGGQRGGDGTAADRDGEGRRVPAGWREGPVSFGGLAVEAGADLRGADLRGAALRGLDLAGCDLQGADLRGADLEACSLRRVNLEGARLDGANLRWADLSHARCSGASFRQADLGEAALAGTVFARADLAGATLAGSVGPGVNFEFANLARADFSGALVTPALIARGRLESTVFPDGSVRG